MRLPSGVSRVGALSVAFITDTVTSRARPASFPPVGLDFAPLTHSFKGLGD
jgi:hypothetical protein